MLKRTADIVLSAAGLVVLAIPLALVAMLVSMDSRGWPFYRQVRLGKNGDWFFIWKVRTMHVREFTDAELTVGDDPRVTRLGRFLRDWKIDEIPQLLNVLLGHMSFVGPRPETLEYGFVYPEQEEVRSIRPGITDPASIRFRNEAALLGEVPDAEAFYREVLLREKTRINLEYVRDHSLAGDIRIILKTLHQVFLERDAGEAASEVEVAELR